jgi:hypothetical protein
MCESNRFFVSECKLLSNAKVTGAPDLWRIRWTDLFAVSFSFFGPQAHVEMDAEDTL